MEINGKNVEQIVNVDLQLNLLSSIILNKEKYTVISLDGLLEEDSLFDWSKDRFYRYQFLLVLFWLVFSYLSLSLAFPLACSSQEV